MTHKSILIIFTRNPILGKVKTRLAKAVGKKTALDIYLFLLQKTKEVTQNIHCDKVIFYSQEILENDLWDTTTYKKELQVGKHLGAKMNHAFETCFKDKYHKVVLIGSDLYDLEASHIEEAFENKNWGTSSVRKDTLKNLEKVDVHLLPMLNDVDVIEDIEHHPAFTKFLSI